MRIYGGFLFFIYIFVFLIKIHKFISHINRNYRERFAAIQQFNNSFNDQSFASNHTIIESPSVYIIFRLKHLPSRVLRTDVNVARGKMKCCCFSLFFLLVCSFFFFCCDFDLSDDTVAFAQPNYFVSIN